MNVLLVTIDCLRRDRCGVYGHHRNTTPTLDTLAQDGFLFENAFSTGPVTTESFPGILAGRLSAQTIAGDTLYQKCLPGGAPTIASHLRDNGWDTAAVISNPRIGEHVGTDHGFEVFRNLRTSSDGTDGSSSLSLLPDFAVGEKLYQLRERMRDFHSLPYRYEIPFLAFRYYQYLSGWPSVRSETVIDTFLDVLATQSSPFFGWTHLMDVHGPLHPQTVTDGGLSDGGPLTQFRSHARRVSDIYDSQTEARYDSSVRYVDIQLQRIIDWLKSNDLWNDTALIITADHGDALHDRGIYGHPQHYLYDELLSVPLIVRIPGRSGRQVTHPYSLGWLHEIVTELCGIGALDASLRSSYESHLEQDTMTDDVLLADSIDQQGHSIAAQQGMLKYVTQTDGLADNRGIRVGPSGYYHLDKDPKERRPTDESYDDLERAALDVRVEPDELREQTQSSSIDDATLDQLKQLGYAGE
ncbi:MAG: sulfatase-like hydrolase/transferase [Halorhabdus sp.]